MDCDVLELAKDQANICRIFGNARRVLILWALVDGEMSVGDIADALWQMNELMEERYGDSLPKFKIADRAALRERLYDNVDRTD